MELKSSKPIFILSSIWVVILLAIAFWWSYLFLNLGTGHFTFNNPRIINMLKWEGAVFLVLLIVISCSLLIYIYKDQKRIKAMQYFFASLTHELKTPLASVKLQSEVIKDLCEEEVALPYIERLIEDVTKLENHMDKALQLSRIERGGNLNLTSVNLIHFIQKMTAESHFPIDLDFDKNENSNIMADEFALKLIFRNLIENTKNHTKNTKAVIKIKKESGSIYLTYDDRGCFEGPVEKLGAIFYKHKSSKGSGIGLYLIKKLMKNMSGEFKITNDQNLLFHLFFKPS